MTNKAHTMLTIALAVAVTMLLMDKTIEPAQAQSCATTSDLDAAVQKIDQMLRENTTLIEGICGGGGGGPIR